MAVGQPTNLVLIHRHREQARSHIGMCVAGLQIL